MANFPNLNVDALFNHAWAPGGQAFDAALKYWQGQLKRNEVGQGEAQLAAGTAPTPVANGYSLGPFVAGGGPNQQASLEGYSGLANENRNARNTARTTQSDVRNRSLSGGLDVGQSYGNSMTDYLQSQIALRNAQANRSGDVLSSFGAIGSSLFGKNGIGTSLLGDALSGSAGGAGELGSAVGGFGSSLGPFSVLGGGAGGFASSLGPFSLLDSSGAAAGAAGAAGGAGSLMSTFDPLSMLGA